MKKSWVFVLILMLVSNILTVELSAEVITGHDPYHEKVRGEEGNGQLAEEALVTVNIPITLVKRELKTILLSEGSPVKKIDRLEFDPMNRLLMIEGDLEVPSDIMHDLEVLEGGNNLKQKHHFKVVLSLPSAKKLALTRWFSLEFKELKLDGFDYTPSLHILGQFSNVLISNTSFYNYMLDVKPEMEVNNDDPVIRVRQLIEKKGVRFRGETVSFKLNLSEFADFSRFSEVEDIRIWQFSPVLLKGSNLMVFRMEAGLGKPGKAWLNDVKKRLENDEQTLSQVRSQFYQELQNKDGILEELKQFKESYQVQIGLKKPNTREKNEIERMDSVLQSKLGKLLTLKNPEFEADPEYVYDYAKKEAQEYIIASLSDIKRRQLIDQKNQTGGSRGSEKPFLEKRISQNTLNQAIRFFREFEFEGDLLLPELHVYLNPELPGIVLRGMMNLDMNWVLAMGLEGTGVDFGNLPIHASKDIYGKAIPFETALRIHMLDDSRIGLDVKSVSLFTGSQRMSYTSTQDHGQFMINFVKMAIVESLATTLIDQAEIRDENEEVPDTYVVLRDNIVKQQSTYDQFISNSTPLQSIDELIRLSEIDISTNPFLTTGQDYVAGKSELFFKNLVKYDDETGLIVFKMDSRLIADNILGSPNNVQVWNTESLYDKTMDQTYLDLSIGNKRRSKKYLDHIYGRDERKDSQEFTGTSDDQGPVDLDITLNLKSFENIINTILADAYNQQNKQVQSDLAQDKESEHYLIRDVNLEAINEGVLRLRTTLTHITKSERAIYNPARWFGDRYPVKKKSISVEAKISLSVDQLEKYSNKVKKSENEVFLGNELLKVDLHSARLTMKGDTSILDKMLNLVARDLDFKRSKLAKKVKILVLRGLSGYLNSTDPKKNGSMELGGVKVNKYAKLLTHDEEILIQLNPRIIAPAFDVHMVKTGNYKNRKVGFVIDKAENTISIDFRTVGNMATVDKGTLRDIMKGAKELFEPYLNEEDPEKFKKMMADLTLFDRSLYNSDYTKMSLYHKLMNVMSEYSGVIENTHPDLAIAEAINNSIGGLLSVAPRKVGSRDITVSGVELMYFVSAALVLEEKLYKLSNKIEEFGLENDIQYAGDFKKKAKDIRERLIIPLFDRYEVHFMEHNRAILEKGPTDWNYNYFPDAIYSDSVYRQVKRLFGSRS